LNVFKENAEQGQAKLHSELSNLQTRYSALVEKYEQMQKEQAAERDSKDQALQFMKNEHDKEASKLESQLAELKVKYESEIEHINQLNAKARSEMIRQHEEEVKSIRESMSHEKQNADEDTNRVLQEKTQELERVRNELTNAEKKQAQALQLANKIKKATTDKITALNEEHSKSMSEANEKHAEACLSLEAEIKSLRESAELAKSEADQLREKLEAVNSTHESSMKELSELKNSAFKELEEKLEQISTDHASSMADLEKDYQSSMATMEAAHQEKMNKLEADNEAKMKAMQDENAANKKKLQQMMAKHADDLKSHYEGKFKALKEENSSLMKRMEEESAESKKKLDSLTKEIEERKAEGGSLQNLLRNCAMKEKSLLEKIESMKKSMADSAESASATANQMLEEQSKLEDQLQDLRSEKNIALNKNEELVEKIAALSNNLSILAEDKKDLEEKLERSAAMLSKYKNAENELNLLRQENNALKLEQTKTQGVLARLNQERDLNEKKHGQRTALVGMLEEQVADLNDSLSETKAKLEAATYDMSQKELEFETLKSDLEKTQQALKESETRSAESSAVAKQLNDNNAVQKSRMIKSLQNQVENLQNQMKKKSAAAQKILKEREAECIELRKTNKFLQNEVDKGSLSDRRIFELAAQQSNRETAAVAEIEIRDRLVARLTEKLEQRDGDLASAELIVEKAEGEVEALSRVHRRENVNMDYLKSIIVQYLSKPPGSSERTALLPVLATLLQFDEGDYKAIEEGKTKVGWWGEIIPTYIYRPEDSTPSTSTHTTPQTAPLLSTSAEVKISNTPVQNSTKKTSLQF